MKMMETVFREAEKEAKKYGYQVEEKFGQIYVTTMYEKWYFYVSANGKIQLMHKGREGKGCADYHRQFKKEISIKDLFCYMNDHEIAKYTKYFVVFTIPMEQKKKEIGKRRKKYARKKGSRRVRYEQDWNRYITV